MSGNILKRCPGCDTHKPATTEYFYAEPNRSDGLAGRCKECHKTRMQRYWKETYYPAHAAEQKRAVTERRRERRKEQSA